MTERRLICSHGEVLRQMADRQRGRLVVEIAVEIAVSDTTVRRRLNDLIERGWVERGPMQGGSFTRGGYRYRLTERGAEAVRDNEDW